MWSKKIEMLEEVTEVNLFGLEVNKEQKNLMINETYIIICPFIQLFEKSISAKYIQSSAK